MLRTFLRVTLIGAALLAAGCKDGSDPGGSGQTLSVAAPRRTPVAPAAAAPPVAPSGGAASPSEGPASPSGGSASPSGGPASPSARAASPSGGPASPSARASRPLTPPTGYMAIAPVGPQRVTLSVTEEGFVPRRIPAKVSNPLTLVITRKTDKTCAREIMFQGQEGKTELPLNKTVEVTYTPKASGEIKFGCAMGMMVGGTIAVLE